VQVLVVGHGAREHALAWSLSRSRDVSSTLIAPGNGGARYLSSAHRVPVDTTDVAGLVACARQEAVDLVVVGPESALAEGLADALAAEGIPVFGPSRQTARLETSKGYAKDFMQRHGIPTADYQRHLDFEAALAYCEDLGYNVALKADGLAAGKGVSLPRTRADAVIALAQFRDSGLWHADQPLVIEERLNGWETSVFALADGKDYRIFAHAQDYKRAYDGNEGPNTGGMGAVSPSPLTPAELAVVEEQVVAPTFAGLSRDGMSYVGILFFGLMMTRRGPMLLEYNARFGDPETQVILPRLRNGIAEAVRACTEGRLREVEFDWDPRPAVGVVMASGGYPNQYGIGHRIKGLDTEGAGDSFVFLAGAEETPDGDVVTDGGRVLTAVGLGTDLASARAAAYGRVGILDFEGAEYRSDIGLEAARR
jgi:phosphoribosylamine--glycine ligase